GTAGHNFFASGDINVQGFDGHVELKAGNNIDVHNVQVGAAGGSVIHATFSASAGNNFIASGDINVIAHAQGSSLERGIASVNILAQNNINVHNILASGSGHQSNVTVNQNAFGFANILLDAVGGNVTGNGNIVAHAFGSDNGSPTVNSRVRGNA